MLLTISSCKADGGLEVAFGLVDLIGITTQTVVNFVDNLGEHAESTRQISPTETSILSRSLKPNLPEPTSSVIQNPAEQPNSEEISAGIFPLWYTFF